MRKRFCAAALALTAALSAGLLTGCSSASGGETIIVRIGHNQSTNHPTHIALAAFEVIYRKQGWETNMMWKYFQASF